MGEHVLLIGMMGAGKSTVGRLVAERLGWPFVDTDAEVERSVGMPVAEIFAARGEAGFRTEEAAVTASVLAGAERSVVSVGGGAVLDPGTRTALRGAGTVVWLRARPDTLTRRVGKGRNRPLLSDDGDGPAAALARIDGQRRALYGELAAEVIDVDDLSPDAVARRVLAVVGAATEDRR